jgi:arylsulfatase
MLFGRMGRLAENVVVVNIKNKAHAITAQLECLRRVRPGVIVAQGDAFGGWALYVTEGRPAYWR